jgi:hypothetical protein
MATVTNDITAQTELACVRAMLNRHYPLIAGHVSRLEADGEEKAAAAWLEVARDVADAIMGASR